MAARARPSARLRVALDGTPLYGQRTGIGRYVEQLMAALVALDEVELSATAFTSRGWRDLATHVPAGIGTRSAPLPARGLRAAWSRAEWPPVHWLAGRSDVFHATSYVLPPTGPGAGVVTVHDLAYLTMPEAVDATSRRLVDLVPRSLRRAAVVCTPTQAIAEAVREAYPRLAHDVRVTPLGVAPSWAATVAPDAAERARRGLPERYLLFIGTREPRKDLRTLLAAHRAARAERPDLPDLVLVGPSGWGDELELHDGVVALPYQAQADVQSAVAGAEAVVMPSRYEGFGLPALEALAAGTSVVVSRDPALLEVTGDHARAFDVGDADGLAACLLDVLDRPDGPSAVSDRRAWAAGWTWERCALATLGAYRAAAAR